MIRNLAVLSFTTGLILASFSALADEFGDRFYNETPKSLGDFSSAPAELPDVAMDDAAKSLQDIMPAAGEEEASDAAEETQLRDTDAEETAVETAPAEETE